MQKKVVILANDKPNVLVKITTLLFELHVDFDDFLSNSTKESGKILITMSLTLNDLAFKKLRRRFLKIQDVLEIYEKADI